ncbi:MAG: LacI family transcriptional regulator, partial [Clostridiales bacterium]|nr:LacI family transcriptional regulator [Clostridiales bacterium]
MQRGRRVTLKDIARETGYTANTVSKALRDGPDLAGDTKRRIREAAERMGYVANAAASSLRSGSTRTIALVIADVANPFFGILVKEVEQCARQNGYSILVMNTEEDGGREVEAIRTAIAKSVDGVLLVPAQRDRAGVALLRRAGIPYVLVGRAFEEGQDDCVLFDDRAGGYLATRHLLEIGRRDILMVNAPGHIYNARERLRGYADALAAFGLAARPERVIELDSALGDVGARLERLAERGVWYDAVFAFSDHLAFAIVCQLQAMG